MSYSRTLSGGSPEEEMAPTPVSSPGESHGQRSLVGYSPWDCKKGGHEDWMNKQQPNTGMKLEEK